MAAVHWFDVVSAHGVPGETVVWSDEAGDWVDGDLGFELSRDISRY